ncbi:hypothetical protein DOY81_000019, partial [Sarcophaga bullata]
LKEYNKKKREKKASFNRFWPRMDDVASVQLENENLRKIRARLLLWESKGKALASLNATQDECMEQINSIWSLESEVGLLSEINVLP